MGRHSVYTEELAAEICDRLSQGETLRGICRSEHMPDEKAVRNWVREDRQGFAPRYARARDMQLEGFAEEILTLGDGVLGVVETARVQAARLATDNRKWLLSKLRPDKYGDRVEHVGAGGKPLIPPQDEMRSAAAALLVLVRAALPKPDGD
jgi:hypothetical protein